MSSGAFVDWLSFTLPVVNRTNVGEYITASIGAVLPTFVWDVSGDSEWEYGRGRPPYSASFRSKGVTAYFNVHLDNILIEISGQGCKALGLGKLIEIMYIVQDRITRIDVAKDFEGDLPPKEILTDTAEGRIKTRSFMKSSTGETAYIGSQKSGQLVRIYRYLGVHPRSGITRVEYMARKKIAKAVVRSVLNNGIDSVYADVVKRFKLPDRVGVDAIPSDLTLERKDRKSSKTLIWLLSSVVPAINKLIESGEIDFDDFVKEHIKNP